MIATFFKYFVFKALLLALSPVLLIIGAIVGFKFTVFLAKRQLKQLDHSTALHAPVSVLPQCDCGVMLRTGETQCRCCSRGPVHA